MKSRATFDGYNIDVDRGQSIVQSRRLANLVSQARISESERFVAIYSPFFITDLHFTGSFGRPCPGIRDAHNIAEYRKLVGSMNIGARSNEQACPSSIYMRKLQCVAMWCPAKYSLLELIIRGEMPGRRSRGTSSNERATSVGGLTRLRIRRFGAAVVNKYRIVDFVGDNARSTLVTTVYVGTWVGQL